MKKTNYLSLALAVTAISTMPDPASADIGEASGWYAAQGRVFFDSPAFPDQESQDFSVAGESTIAGETGGWSWRWRPYLRLDSADSERTHFDLREAIAQRPLGPGTVRAGFGKVFWGVAESQHLVDIINQTDLVEDPDGEEKLGQPMVSYQLAAAGGNLEAFILPGSRSRTFPGADGRLRFSLPVESTEYESDAERKHIDAALRYAASLGQLELGLSYFNGTTRDPAFRPAGLTELTAVYEQISQFGLDTQYLIGGLALKLEALRRTDQKNLSFVEEDFTAATGGIEYTFARIPGMPDSSMALVTFLEYLYDSRGQQALTSFEDDVFLGFRLDVNDAADTTIELGVIKDASDPGTVVSFEAEHRLGKSYRLSLVSRFFDLPPGDFLADLSEDDYIEINLAYHF